MHNLLTFTSLKFLYPAVTPLMLGLFLCPEPKAVPLPRETTLLCFNTATEISSPCIETLATGMVAPFFICHQKLKFLYMQTLTIALGTDAATQQLRLTQIKQAAADAIVNHPAITQLAETDSSINVHLLIYNEADLKLKELQQNA